ncbi:MAG: hypothetical protein EP345_00975, partial [Sphingomonadales bacterium]
TLEMAPLEIRHRSVRPISAKHAQASRFLQQSPKPYPAPETHIPMMVLGILNVSRGPSCEQ